MVRHHVKKKKVNVKANASKKEQKIKELEDDLENLDRFAGSSDEEGGSDDSDDDASDDEDGAPTTNMARAGGESSDSDNSEDDYDDVYQENMAKGKEVVKPEKQTGRTTKQNDVEVDSDENEEDGSSEDDYNNDEQSDDDEMTAPSPRSAKSAGMANAMSRILGGQTFQSPDADTSAPMAAAAAAKPVILSKTTTPLQRLQQKIKTEEQALRQKRHSRRTENLSAMRLPLAPTAGMSAEKLWKQTKKKSKRKRGSSNEDEEEAHRNDNALAIAYEIEGERAHRRIATRGVVALFNAISKHRAVVASEAAAKEEEKRRIREEGRQSRFGKKKSDEGEVRTKTKHGFLDMIKKSAAVGASKGDENDGGGGRVNGADKSKESGSSKEASSKSTGWSALKDDFMMNSKLKDWDKDISDDEDDEIKPKPVDPKAEKDSEKKKGSRVKRQKVWVS